MLEPEFPSWLSPLAQVELHNTDKLGLSHFQLISSGVAHPTPDTVPARKSSIIQVPKKSLNYLITCYLLQGVAGQGHQVLF